MIEATHRYRFAASHVLTSPALSAEENARAYGKCANPNGHGHDYGLEITLAGRVDPLAGWLAPPARLDDLVRERILDRFGHCRLNDDPLFSACVPTAENIAIAVHAELSGPVEALGEVRLVRVRVVETPRNAFEYGEPA